MLLFPFMHTFKDYLMLIAVFALGWVANDGYRKAKASGQLGLSGSDSQSAAVQPTAGRSSVHLSNANQVSTPATVEAAGGGMPIVSAPSTVSTLTGANGVVLKSQQASVQGLLVASMQRGEAGTVSKMSGIALPTSLSMPVEVMFNQDVGEMMYKALAEVQKFTQLRHKGWPKGYTIEFSFADKYSSKDGPSAAIACALLLNSMIIGKENDPWFAVTGDMNADGSVQPIGGVAAKIRGATNGRCKIVAIPAKNENSLADLLLTDGPAPFASIQIYSVSSFDEAEALALKEKPAATQNAIDEMARVQEVLLKDKAQVGAWLRNQHVLSKLEALRQAAPNNLSAKYLLVYANGRVPQSLTLAGSLDAVENAAAELIDSIKANNGQSHNALRKDVVGSSITRLQNLRAKCDPRIRPYADSVVRFGSAVKEAQDRPANSTTRANLLVSTISAAARTAESEFKRLINDPMIREELEQ
jgi:hypothetical protein